MGGPITRLDQIQDGGRLPSWKTENCNNSTAIWDIVIKFGKVVGMDSPQRAVTSLFTVNKIQDGGWPPFWKKENRHNSAPIADILTKFGVLVAMVSPQRACSEISCNVKWNVYLAMGIPDCVSFISGQNSDDRVRSCEPNVFLA